MILDQLIPREQYEPYLEGRPLDYLQPLADLGFLRFSQTEDKAAVRTALKMFRAAYRELSWLSADRVAYQNSPPPIDEPDSLEIKLLHLLVDMDGDFQVAKIPQTGSLNILSRVIYYRLRLHGFWQPGDQPQPYDPDLIDRVLTKINNWIPLNITVLEWVNLLGNIPELIRRTYDHGGLDRQIVCFKYRPRTAFKKDFRKEITSESESVLARESAELEEIKSELSQLRSDRTAADMEPPAATTRKNRRRQSEVEKLRLEINRGVDQIGNTLEKKRVVGDRFQPDILAAEEKLKAAKLAAKHQILDLKELKDSRKSFSKLKQHKKTITENIKTLNKKLKEILNNSADVKGILLFQVKKIKNLRELETNAPDRKKSKIRREIESTQKNTTRLRELIRQMELLRFNEQQRTERDQLDQKISDEKKKRSTLENEITRIENGLTTLKKNQKRAVDKLDIKIGETQKKLKEKANRYQRLLKKVKKIPRRFRRELREYLAPDFYGTVKKQLLDRENSTFFSATLKNPYNQFLVRLLQLHQWTNGYYNGLIDSDLGRRTFRSIREIDRDINRMKLRFVLYQLNPLTGTWLLNIRYLFGEMIDSLETFKEKDDFETVVRQYESEIANNPNIRKQKGRIDQELKRTVKEVNKNRENNKLRRVYFGTRSLARSIVRGMSRLVGLIVKGLKLVIKGIKVFYRLLRNFVLMLYREIREGLRKFGQGIAFLFGKRQITTSFDNGSPAIVTRFDFDCDVRTLASPGAGAYFEAHRDHCHRVTHNLEFALILTARIVEWSLQAIRLSWLNILIKIALHFKKLIKTFLKRNMTGIAVQTFKA